MSELAIVIPAYKAKYLKDALYSLSIQSDERFTVYVGDDCSSDNIQSIVDLFKDKLNIIYHRFDENMGSYDLVGQWNRCLALMEDEPWFMMFSDDDILDPSCIGNLLDEILKYDYDVFHFNLRFINENGILVSEPQVFDSVISSNAFFDKLFDKKIEARMPEFVFRKACFDQLGGFVSFDNAMFSDTATVMKCGFSKGIKTIEKSYVYWRVSGLNVSIGGNSKTKYLAFYQALVCFFNWRDSFYLAKGITDDWNRIRKIDYLFNYGFNLKRMIGINAFLRVLYGYKLLYRFPFLFKDVASLIKFKLSKRLM